MPGKKSVNLSPREKDKALTEKQVKRRCGPQLEQCRVAKKRTALTLEKKREVVKYKEENPRASVRAIANKFGVGKTQIAIIIR